jgi:hypothetical protein
VDDGAFIEVLTSKRAKGVVVGKRMWRRDGEMYVPFLSSIVTVSFAHFIRNLPGAKRSVRSFESEP